MDPTAQYPESFLREYRGDECENVAIAFIVLVTVTVLVRFFAKTRTDAPLAADDYLIIPSWVACIANATLAIISVRQGGVGYHFVEVERSDPHAIQVWEKVLFGLQWTYAFATAFPKLSILFLYLRIFPMRNFRLAAYILMFLVLGLCFSIIMASLFQCSPIAFAWDKTIQDGKCINQLAYFRWITPPNLVIDLGLLILPVPVIWSLNAGFGQKIGLTLTFVTGSIGIIAACVRMSVFFRNNAFEDVTWTAVTLVIWTVIEPSFYTIAVCLPSFRPLCVQLYEHLQSRGLVPRTSIKQSNSWPSSTSASRHRSGLRGVTGEKTGESSSSRISISGGPHGSKKGPGPDREAAWTDPHADTIPLNSIKVAHDVTVE